jgi:hypothetical protein
MKSLRALVTFTAVVALPFLVPISSAQAVKPSPTENHGQCVSSSPMPDGPGGRSTVAKDKTACPAPLPCTTFGDATFDSAADTATVRGTGPGSLGSSVSCTTSIPVVAGDTISADYVFGPGTDPCGGGVPRMYVVIDGVYYNTFDDNPNECEATSTSLVLPVGGVVTEVGFVYDRGDFGSVTYSNAMVGNTPIDF